MTTRPAGAAEAPAGGALVEMRGVVKVYRRGAEEVRALNGVELALYGGELLALVGPSGSGKSTLLLILGGWDTPTEGRVLLSSDLDAATPDRLPWSGLAVVPQSLGLLEDLSLADNVELPARLAGRPDPERAAALLRRVDLADVALRRPAETSLGEQQRAAVARALAVRPRVLLVDGPMTHVADDRATVLMTLLRQAADEGATVVVATHDALAVDFADRVVEVRDGVVVERAVNDPGTAVGGRER